MTVSADTVLADIAVVGGGIAGSAAALRAAQAGARVLVLEESENRLAAGNSLMTSGSFNAAGVSPLTSPDELYHRAMAEGRANPALARAWAATCGPAVEWLRAAGVIVEPDETGHHWLGGGTEVSHAPAHVSGVGATVITRLQDGYRALGGSVAPGSRVTGIERNARGGFLITRDAQAPVAARVVVLATGGFAASPELLARYLGPSSGRSKLRGSTANRGDGLTFALGLGARTVNTEYTYSHLLCAGAADDDSLWPYPRLDEVMPEAILVDRSGHRFLDEGTGDVAVSNRLARHQDPLGATLIFDARAWETRGHIRHHPALLPPAEAITSEKQGLFAAADARGLAVALGLNPEILTSELDQYNAWFNGTGARLGVPRSVNGRPLEIPLFGLRVIPGITFTAGGIQIDAGGGVVGSDGTRIADLYAAGDAIGGLMGGDRGGYLGGLMQAVATGLLAGVGAAEGTATTKNATTHGETHA
jgi:fumarate reductase flavoprotein subunit